MVAQLIALLRAFWYWVAIAVLCLALLLLASWKWFFVFTVTFTVFYLGLSALLGRQRLATIPARLAIGFVVLFFFTKLAYELSRWLLWHEPSEMLSRAWYIPSSQGIILLYIYRGEHETQLQEAAFVLCLCAHCPGSCPP